MLPQVELLLIFLPSTFPVAVPLVQAHRGLDHQVLQWRSPIPVLSAVPHFENAATLISTFCRFTKSKSITSARSATKVLHFVTAFFVTYRKFITTSVVMYANYADKDLSNSRILRSTDEPCTGYRTHSTLWISMLLFQVSLKGIEQTLSRKAGNNKEM